MPSPPSHPPPLPPLLPSPWLPLPSPPVPARPPSPPNQPPFPPPQPLLPVLCEDHDLGLGGRLERTNWVLPGEETCEGTLNKIAGMVGSLIASCSVGLVMLLPLLTGPPFNEPWFNRPNGSFVYEACPATCGRVGIGPCTGRHFPISNMSAVQLQLIDWWRPQPPVPPALPPLPPSPPSPLYPPGTVELTSVVQLRAAVHVSNQSETLTFWVRQGANLEWTGGELWLEGDRRLILHSSGSGATFDARGRSRFVVCVDCAMTLSRIHLINGQTTGRGGAMRASGASIISLLHVSISHCASRQILTGELTEPDLTGRDGIDNYWGQGISGGAVMLGGGAIFICDHVKVSNCTVEGGGVVMQGGAIHSVSDGAVVLSHTQLISCCVEGSSTTLMGGALCMEMQGSVLTMQSSTVTNCKIKGGIIGYGGGVSCWGDVGISSPVSIFTIEQSVFCGCCAEGSGSARGGAIDFNNQGHELSSSLSRCLLIGCSSVATEGLGSALGGGMSCFSLQDMDTQRSNYQLRVELMGVVLRSCVAWTARYHSGALAKGGGCYLGRGLASLTDCTFESCLARGGTAQGGAIAVGDGNNAIAVLRLAHSDLYSNSADSSGIDSSWAAGGGGIFVLSGFVQLSNQTQVHGNSVSGSDDAGANLYLAGGVTTYSLPAPLGFWVAAAECRVNYESCPESNLYCNRTEMGASRFQQCDWANQPELLHRWLETLPNSPLKGDYPYRCGEGLVGASYLVTAQSSSRCERVCPHGGYFCPQATTIPQPPGSYCPNGTLPCMRCQKGHWCTAGAMVACPFNTFNEIEGGRHESTCKMCPANSITEHERSETIQSCVCHPGWYMAENATCRAWSVTGAEPITRSAESDHHTI